MLRNIIQFKYFNYRFKLKKFYKKVKIYYKRLYINILSFE